MFDMFKKFDVGIGAESKVLDEGMGPDPGGLGAAFISASCRISSNTVFALLLFFGLIVSSMDVS